MFFNNTFSFLIGIFISQIFPTKKNNVSVPSQIAWIFFLTLFSCKFLYYLDVCGSILDLSFCFCGAKLCVSLCCFVFCAACICLFSGLSVHILFFSFSNKEHQTYQTFQWHNMLLKTNVWFVGQLTTVTDQLREMCVMKIIHSGTIIWYTFSLWKNGLISQVTYFWPLSVF